MPNQMPIGNYRVSSIGPDQREWNLALVFQEVITAVVRVRFGRQAVQNADTFRSHIKNSLKLATQDALGRGYSQEDVRLAIYAMVAFVDESVMNKQAAFSDWSRLPLEEELFGGHVAGESFFNDVQQLLSRPESTQTTDLMEVFYLCLLMGYKGRYASDDGSRRAIMEAVREKIRQVRGSAGDLSPHWKLPASVVEISHADPQLKRYGLIAIGAFGVACLLFICFKLILISGTGDVRALAGQLRF
jgi:type VI secretion system protein ImpK